MWSCRSPSRPPAPPRRAPPPPGHAHTRTRTKHVDRQSVVERRSVRSCVVCSVRQPRGRLQCTSVRRIPGPARAWPGVPRQAAVSVCVYVRVRVCVCGCAAHLHDVGFHAADGQPHARRLRRVATTRVCVPHPQNTQPNTLPHAQTHVHVHTHTHLHVCRAREVHHTVRVACRRSRRSRRLAPRRRHCFAIAQPLILHAPTSLGSACQPRVSST